METHIFTRSIVQIRTFTGLIFLGGGSIKTHLLLDLFSFSTLHKTEVGRVLLRCQFRPKRKIQRQPKPMD